MFTEYGLVKLAAQQMIGQNFLIFDSETSGLGANDEIVELGVIDCQGNVLYSGLFRPENPLSEEVTKLTGITHEMLANAPRFTDEYAKITELMAHAVNNGGGVIAFNESFDERLFYQTAARYGLDTDVLDRIFSHAYCAQQLYDQFVGYRQTKLELACRTEGVEAVQDHRATGDCLMTLEMMRCVADPTKMPSLERYVSVRAEATGKSFEEVLVGHTLDPRAADRLMAGRFVEPFKAGKSIEEIAAGCGVPHKTVEDAVFNAYAVGTLKSIDALVQERYVNPILEIIQEPTWNRRFTSVKNRMPEDCTWSCIRAVITKWRGGEYPVAELSNEKKTLDDQIAGAASDVSPMETSHVVEPSR